MKLWIVGGVLTWWAQLHAQPAPKPAVPASCLAADADPVLIAIDGNKLRQCTWDGAHLSCFATDLATGAWSTAAAPASTERPRIAPAAGAPKIDVADQSASVCHADGSACKTLTPKAQVDPGLGLSAAANEAGTIGALGYYGDKPWVETFDLATGKRLGRAAAGSKAVKCIAVNVLGDALYVDESVCGGEVSTAWLGSKTGKRIAAVGGAQPIHPSGHAVHLADTQWAFSTSAGDVVVVQDVKTGKVAKRIAVGAAVDTASASLLGDSKRLVLAFGGSRAGDVAVIDVASAKVTSYPGKRCAH
jgi:hypothetical protein